MIGYPLASVRGLLGILFDFSRLLEGISWQYTDDSDRLGVGSKRKKVKISTNKTLESESVGGEKWNIAQPPTLRSSLNVYNTRYLNVPRGALEALKEIFKKSNLTPWGVLV